MRHAVRNLCVLPLALFGGQACAATASGIANGAGTASTYIGQMSALPGEAPGFEAVGATQLAASGSTEPARASLHVDSNMLIGGNLAGSNNDQSMSMGGVLKSFRNVLGFEQSETEFRRKLDALVPIPASITLILLLLWLSRTIWRRVHRMPLGWSA